MFAWLLTLCKEWVQFFYKPFSHTLLKLFPRKNYWKRIQLERRVTDEESKFCTIRNPIFLHSLWNDFWKRKYLILLVVLHANCTKNARQIPRCAKEIELDLQWYNMSPLLSVNIIFCSCKARNFASKAKWKAFVALQCNFWRMRRRRSLQTEHSYIRVVTKLEN